MNIERKNIEGQSITDANKRASDISGKNIRRKADNPNYEFKPKRKPSTMKTVIKWVRDTAAGLITGGGAFAFTGDIVTAVIVGVSALLIALGVDFEVVKKFKELFDDNKS